MFEDPNEILLVIGVAMKQPGLTDLRLVTVLHDNAKSLVIRAETQTDPPSRVIVKVFREDAEATFAREKSFLHAICPAEVGPRVLGELSTRAILALEDLGDDSDELALATALGRLHEAELGSTGTPPTAPHLEMFPTIRELQESLRSRMRRLGLDVPRGLEDETEELMSALSDRPHATPIHGDVHPSNSRRSGSKSFLIDFGHAGLGHPGIDSACLVAGYPTLRPFTPTSPEMVKKLMKVYAESRSMTPLVLEREVVVGCGYWILRVLHGSFLNPERVVSDPSLLERFAPQLVHVLGAASSRAVPLAAFRSAADSLRALIEDRLRRA